MNKELLFSVTRKDLDIQWYSGSGAGGQHRNKHQNCCRIRHIESGAEGSGTESRSRDQNKSSAFKRLVECPTFQLWAKRKATELMMDGETIKQKVDKSMSSENIRVETMDENGKWQAAVNPATVGMD